jgi:hypothetical protein
MLELGVDGVEGEGDEEGDRPPGDVDVDAEPGHDFTALA